MSLKTLLDERNISMYRLSKLSGVSKTVIIDICSGKSSLENCTAKTVYQIATTLNCSVEELLNMCVTPNSAKLEKYGITFPVSSVFQKDFIALEKGVKNNVSYVDCLQDSLSGDVRALYNAKKLTTEQVEFIENNFILSCRGFENG